MKSILYIIVLFVFTYQIYGAEIMISDEKKLIELTQRSLDEYNQKSYFLYKYTPELQSEIEQTFAYIQNRKNSLSDRIISYHNLRFKLSAAECLAELKKDKAMIDIYARYSDNKKTNKFQISYERDKKDVKAELERLYNNYKNVMDSYPEPSCVESDVETNKRYYNQVIAICSENPNSDPAVVPETNDDDVVNKVADADNSTTNVLEKSDEQPVPKIPQDLINYLEGVVASENVDYTNLITKLEKSKEFLVQKNSVEFIKLWNNASGFLSDNLLKDISARGDSLVQAEKIIRQNDLGSIVTNYDVIEKVLNKEQGISYVTLSNNWIKTIIISVDGLEDANVNAGAEKRFTFKNSSTQRVSFILSTDEYDKKNMDVDIVGGYDCFKESGKLEKTKPKLFFVNFQYPDKSTGLILKYHLKGGDTGYTVVRNPTNVIELLAGQYDVLIGADDYSQTNILLVVQAAEPSSIEPDWNLLKTDRLQQLEKLSDMLSGDSIDSDDRSNISKLYKKNYTFQNKQNQKQWNYLVEKWFDVLNEEFKTAENEYKTAMSTNMPVIEKYNNKKFSEITSLISKTRDENISIEDRIIFYNEAKQLIPESLQVAKNNQKIEEEKKRKIQLIVEENDAKIDDFIGWYYEVGNPDGLKVENIYRKDYQPPIMNISFVGISTLPEKEKERFASWNDIVGKCIIYNEDKRKPNLQEALNSIKQYRKTCSVKDNERLNVLYDMISNDTSLSTDNYAKTNSCLIYLVKAHKYFTKSKWDFDSSVLERLYSAKNCPASSFKPMDYIIGIYNTYFMWSTDNEHDYIQTVKTTNKILADILNSISQDHAEEVVSWLLDRSQQIDKEMNASREIVYILPKMPTFIGSNNPVIKKLRDADVDEISSDLIKKIKKFRFD